MIQSKKIKFILLFLITGFLASVVYHFFLANFLNLNFYPFNTFLFRPDNRFGDFFDNFNAGEFPYLQESPSRAMFPFFVFLSRILFFLQNKLVLLGLFLTLFLFGFVSIINYVLRDQPVSTRTLFILATILCSYPILISLDRANFENACFLFVFLSVIFLQKKRYHLSSIFLGLAIAVKPYSVFFLPLFLIEGQIIPAVSSAMIALVLNLASFLVIPTPFLQSIHVLQTNLGLYNNSYVIGNEGLYFGSSIFGIIKILAFWLGGAFNWFPATSDIANFINSTMRPYFLITMGTFGVLVILLLLYKNSLWKSTAILACSLALFPYVGSSYRLLYFFIPLAYLLIETKTEPLDKLYLILFGAILIPYGYLHYDFLPQFMVNPWEVDDSVIIRPLVITILLIFLVRDLLSTRALNDNFLKLVGRLNFFSGT